MKIAKKFMTLALAAALGVGCATVGVGAAPGNTSDMAAVAPSKTSETTVDSEHSSIYEVVKELDKTQGFADLQTKYKDLAKKRDMYILITEHFLYLFFFCIKRFPDFTFCSLDRVIF